MRRHKQQRYKKALSVKQTSVVRANDPLLGKKSIEPRAFFYVQTLTYNIYVYFGYRY